MQGKRGEGDRARGWPLAARDPCPFLPPWGPFPYTLREIEFYYKRKTDVSMGHRSRLSGWGPALLFLRGGALLHQGSRAGTPASPPWPGRDLALTPQDSPSNKLLYAKEISTYKKMVEE